MVHPSLFCHFVLTVFIAKIALDYGFSSHEAFLRSFKEAYGVTPGEYRSNPVPVVLRTIIKPFDCCLISIGGTGMASTTEEVKVCSGGRVYCI